MSFPDSVDAIFAATNHGKATGHDLAGFKRRIGSYGYRFVARCRRCRREIVVGRVSAGWAYASPPGICSSDAQQPRRDGRMTADAQ